MRVAISTGLLSVALLHTSVASAVTFKNVSDDAKLSGTASKASWWFDVKFEDFDNDGNLDLFWADHSMTDSAFLLNQGNGTFKESSEAFLDKYGGTSVWNLQPIDFNNDGWMDLILVSGDTGGTTHKNNGNGTFSKVQLIKSWDDANAHGTSVADIDGDGWLDVLYNRNGSAIAHRKPDGTYEDFAAKTGLDPALRGLPSVFADLNGDGKPDLFTYYCPGSYCISGQRKAQLLINDGSGTFVDKIAGTDLASAPGVAAIAVGDYDNDGDLDLYITGLGPSDTTDTGTLLGRLYNNDGKGVFTDVTSKVGLPLKYGTSVTSYSMMPSRATWADLDNDGRLDLLMSTTGKTNIYKNKQDGTFEDITSATGVTIATRQLAVGDYDNDGDLDIASVDVGNFLFKNETNDQNWLKIRLTGCSIKSAVGSRIWVYESGTKNLKGFREVIQASNHEAPLVQHFGLSADKKYDVHVSFYPEVGDGAETDATGVSPGKLLPIGCRGGTLPDGGPKPDGSRDTKPPVSDTAPPSRDVAPRGDGPLVLDLASSPDAGAVPAPTPDAAPVSTIDAPVSVLPPAELDAAVSQPEDFDASMVLGGADAGAKSHKSSSGCGCLLGGAFDPSARSLPLLALGLLALCRFRRR